MRTRILVIALGAFFGAVSAHAGLINGGFEAGDLSGWTRFTTANGSLPDLGDEVVAFDIAGDGALSNAARFRVGEAVLLRTGGGGGIFQGVVLGAGELLISADIAVATAGFGNSSAGLFELLFDGAVVDSHDFGSIDADAVERSSLLAALDVTAGPHELRLRMTRPLRESWQTPLDFVDNVSLSGEAVDAIPEPASITLLGLGLLGLARARRRQRSH